MDTPQASTSFPAGPLAAQDSTAVHDIAGTADADTLHGGKGHDHIDGGDGVDTLVLGSWFDDYVVSFDATDGSYRVAHRSAPEQADTLVNVERLRFSDIDVAIDDAVAAQEPGAAPLQLLPTGGDDRLVGGDAEFLIWGGEGDDQITGNGGDDHLYGGKGDDTAVYQGALADYELTFDATTFSYRIGDRQAGRDGRDELIGIERLQFADGVVELFGTGGARVAGGAEILAPWQAPEPEDSGGLLVTTTDWPTGVQAVSLPDGWGLEDGAVAPDDRFAGVTEPGAAEEAVALLGIVHRPGVESLAIDA